MSDERLFSVDLINDDTVTWDKARGVLRDVLGVSAEEADMHLTFAQALKRTPVFEGGQDEVCPVAEKIRQAGLSTEVVPIQFRKLSKRP